jgi:hypothetical protein
MSTAKAEKQKALREQHATDRALLHSVRGTHEGVLLREEFALRDKIFKRLKASRGSVLERLAIASREARDSMKSKRMTHEVGAKRSQRDATEQARRLAEEAHAQAKRLNAYEDYIKEEEIVGQRKKKGESKRAYAERKAGHEAHRNAATAANLERLAHEEERRRIAAIERAAQHEAVPHSRVVPHTGVDYATRANLVRLRAQEHAHRSTAVHAERAGRVKRELPDEDLSGLFGREHKEEKEHKRPPMSAEEKARHDQGLADLYGLGGYIGLDHHMRMMELALSRPQFAPSGVGGSALPNINHFH